MVETDSTVANAGLTEIEEGSAVALTNGHTEEPAPVSSIPNADVQDSAANASGESQWDTAAPAQDLTMSQEWVEVEPPAAETSPAAAANTNNNQSWADDHPEAATDAPAASGADGFHQVQRTPRGGGFHRGRGDRGGYRGRGGHRGDGRGRGRGRGRGGPRRGGDEQPQQAQPQSQQ